MARLHVVLLSGRFWPLVGGAEKAMARLGEEFTRRGWRVTVLTAQPGGHPPAAFDLHGMHVVRLPRGAGRQATAAYLWRLAAWLRRHRRQYDAVLCSMLKHEAAVATLAARPRPVILRAEGAGASGDCRWQQQGRLGAAVRWCCRRADAIVAPSPQIVDELHAAGYPADRVRWIANGVPERPAATTESRAVARRLFAETHPAMTLPADARLALFAGRLDEAKGVLELVSAWRRLAQSWPAARLWIAGDGPARVELFRQIERHGLAGRVVPIGAFDDAADLLWAADLFVFPSHVEGLSLALLEAMMAGLPIVASDIPGNRAALADGVEGLLTPVRQSEAVAAAVESILADPARAARLGAAARRRAQAEFTLRRMADCHAELIAALCEGGGLTSR